MKKSKYFLMINTLDNFGNLTETNYLNSPAPFASFFLGPPSRHPRHIQNIDYSESFFAQAFDSSMRS
jgi:hypothetical protein